MAAPCPSSPTTPSRQPTCSWTAAHPEATLRCYTHDGQAVYFDGKPLAGRKGEPLEVDTASLAPVGGRGLRDAHRIYGGGQRS